ncbi:MAG: hypothetical protein DRI57_05245 [Deltaproteobacteria bacterium]|nr:MAG: hypothetical protein DRI57_05245 [Deltaproteobacteria bacterium]
MKVFKYIPLFFYLLIIYNILVFSGGDNTQNILDLTLIEAQLISGAMFMLDGNGLLIILGVISLCIEVFKSTRTSVVSVIDHAFSMLVFIAFLVEFIVVKNAGTSSFLILTLMALFDVIAGFAVTISSARRDLLVTR